VRFWIGQAPFDRWTSYDEMAAAVAAAEKAGFDYVTLPDHILIPEGPEQPRSGVVFPDVMPLAAFLAARTSRIQFVFAALVVPVREPITLAKQLATIDQVSGGRLAVVVGSGWLRSEFEALGVGFEDRGDRVDEYVRVLKTCWTEPRPSFQGRYVSFGPSVEPKCAQQPGLRAAPAQRGAEHPGPPAHRAGGRTRRDIRPCRWRSSAPAVAETVVPFSWWFGWAGVFAGGGCPPYSCII
jgi:alkanesulfonate monooxygenase SsuD/methylene tetrahydromethanopterin reductase-like flavin-dependent oxidoreductase (luciferase family)